MPTKNPGLNRMGPKAPKRTSPTLDQSLPADAPEQAKAPQGGQMKRTSVDLPIEVHERLRRERYETGKGFRELITTALMEKYPLD